MSYDIHVFDPAAAPIGREALRAWLAGPARDEQPSALITRAVGVLQQFYRPLSEAPDTLTEGEHFADYAPEGALLSLSAPWYDAEDLTAVVHRLATEHGWGFDDVSVTDGMLWRPDPARQVDPTPLGGASLTVENGGTHADPSPALLAASVDWIADHRGPAFAILNLGEDDYVQYAGGRDGLTVERRTPAATPPGFRHTVAATSASTAGDLVDLPGATRSFRVLPNEVLSAPDAVTLVLASAQGASVPASIAWHDITSTFGA
ncbi:hypothetical protein SAMN04487788_0737 [Microbacterium testaceum StLB037]|uniref:Uncharacterized protein n=1 Tax=Microbacterium testaceum (strain StLB037) TaxID=979556 RepID=A0A1H0M5A4_MICTS|nr:hypothetical protein [Microbacterium testaceum]SDO75672.1 hypothetical protein SAMN04487788_0737 [Microbacterium testaceum StLB037]